jgi:ankyrin repeat protein
MIFTEYFLEHHEEFESYVLFAKFLIKYGANVNRQDELGNTILHRFFAHGGYNLEYIIFLYGTCFVDDSIQNKEGHSAFDLMPDNKREEMIRNITYYKRKNFLTFFEGFEIETTNHSSFPKFMRDEFYVREICSFMI